MSEPTDGGYGWVVVGASFFLNIIVVGIPRSFGVVYVVIRERFSATATTVSFIHSLFNFLKMVLGPLSSYLCARFSARKVVLFGSVLVSAGMITCALSTSVLHVCVTYGVVAGIGGSFLYVPSLIVINDYFNKNKGKAMSISSMGGGIGTIILAPLVTFLMSYYGFQGGFLLIGGLALNCFVAAALLRPKDQPIKTKEVKELEIIVKTDEKSETKLPDEVEPDIKPSDKENIEITDEKQGTKESVPKSRVKECFKSCSFQLLLNRTFLFYCSCLATLPFCIQVLLLFIADFAKENSIGQRERAILISVMGAADIVGRIVAGVLLDLKFVQHKRTHVQLGTGMLLGALTMCVALGQNVPLLYTICILQGIVEGMFHSQRATILSDFVPKEQQPLATGWIIFFQGIGNFCGPIIGGLIKDNLKSYEAVFIIGGALFLIATASSYVNIMLNRWCNRNSSDQ